MKYRIEVKADNTGKWYGNQMRFDTFKEAEDYARDLEFRWWAVTDWRVVEDKDDAGTGGHAPDHGRCL